MSELVIEYYKTHNMQQTMREFHISYRTLKKLLDGYTKTPEQIKQSYRDTKILHFGSYEAYCEHVKTKRNETIEDVYRSKELYNFIRDNNAKESNLKKYGCEYPKQKKEE